MEEYTSSLCRLGRSSTLPIACIVPVSVACAVQGATSMSTLNLWYRAPWVCSVAVTKRKDNARKRPCRLCALSICQLISRFVFVVRTSYLDSQHTHAHAPCTLHVKVSQHLAQTLYCSLLLAPQREEPAARCPHQSPPDRTTLSMPHRERRCTAAASKRTCNAAH